MPAQTAHDQGYLVKHLLSGLPNVTDRVRAMRAGRPHLNAEDRKSEMIASQEAYIKARGRAPRCTAHCPGTLWWQVSCAQGHAGVIKCTSFHKRRISRGSQIGLHILYDTMCSK